MLARFTKDDDEISSTEAEALFDSSRDRDARIVIGHVTLVAEDPQAAGAIVQFECACVHHCERIHDTTGNVNFFVMKSSRIAIEQLNAHPIRA